MESAARKQKFYHRDVIRRCCLRQTEKIRVVSHLSTFLWQRQKTMTWFVEWGKVIALCVKLALSKYISLTLAANRQREIAKFKVLVWTHNSKSFIPYIYFNVLATFAQVFIFKWRFRCCSRRGCLLKLLLCACRTCCTCSTIIFPFSDQSHSSWIWLVGERKNNRSTRATNQVDLWRRPCRCCCCF